MSTALLATLLLSLSATPTAGPTDGELAAALEDAVAALGRPELAAELPAPAPERATARTLDDPHLPTFPDDPRAWRERAEAVRRRALVATGTLVDRHLRARVGFEPPRTRTTRRIERGDYVVEALAFEVLPGFWATGSLYRPSGDAPARSRPAVLTPHGHWADGRLQARDAAGVAAELASGRERLPEAARHPLQARCVAFARAGWVVLLHDMLGYADNTQLAHHGGFADAEALAWGASRAELQTWTSMRALDLLCALPEVDPERLAVTGASGGGTQAFLLAAVDDRPLVSAPVNMVSGAMQGGCVCENAAHLRVGTDNVELAALHAPRPQLLVAADDWTKALGARDARELRALYRTLGRPDAFDLAAFLDHPHNYDAASRGAVLGFLLEHLGPGPGVDADAARVERGFEPLGRDELVVWGAGVERPAGYADAEGVRAALLARARAQRDALAADPDAHRALARVALEVLTGLQDRSARGPLGTERVVAAAAPGAALPWTWLRIEAQPGHLTAGEADDRARLGLLVGAARGTEERLTLLALPGGAPRLAAEARGEHGALAPVLPAVAGLVRAGEVVLVVDAAPPEGPPRVDPGRHGSSPHYTYAYTLAGLADEVRGLVRWLDECVRADVQVVGLEEAGPLALLAAPLALRAPRAVVADLAFGLEAPSDVDDGRLLPGALRYGGVDGFAALLAPTPLTLAAREALPPFVAAAYADTPAAASARAASAAELLAASAARD